MVLTHEKILAITLRPLRLERPQGAGFSMVLDPVMNFFIKEISIGCRV
jgi:hypothetical protein